MTKFRMAADPTTSRCSFSGVATQKRGVATWHASLTHDQGVVLYDLLCSDDEIDTCIEEVPGSVVFDTGEVREICRFNIAARRTYDRHRIWLDYMLDGDTPDAPSEDIEAILLTEERIADMGRVLGLVLGGMVDADQIALCANAGITADEWAELSSEPGFAQRASMMGALRPSRLVAREGWVDVVCD